ncbi:MAG: DUF2610 domain-containing protein [Wolbachia endosymbiont of Menacanthus eurysternus]|nr:MAG: DUF2610 domain-containing protein [Wolbachia endosymbiont of Menacanthus eurysternus]
MTNFIKKITVQCDFNGQRSPFVIHIGNPRNNTHPIHHQDFWLARERRGSIPNKVKESLQKLYRLSQQNGIPFSELCAYAINILNIKHNKNNS